MQQNTTIRLNIIEKPPGQTGCAVILKRWVVEHSIAWAGRNRLASKDYNRNPESSEAFCKHCTFRCFFVHSIYLASIGVCVIIVLYEG
jgi:hypothetical protein